VFTGPVPLRLQLARLNNLLIHYAKGNRLGYPPSIACIYLILGSLSPPFLGSFHLSLTVLFTIRHWRLFRLRGWYPIFRAAFAAAPLESFWRNLPDYHRLWSRFPTFSISHSPYSLAATNGLSLDFFSTRY